MTDAQARQQIELYLNWNSFPALSVTEVDFLLLDARRPDQDKTVPDRYLTWRPSFAYALGTLIVPDPRDGFYYEATVAGTSGATQPTFPTVIDATVVDGGVTWKNKGSAPWVPTYSTAYAIYRGWNLKSAKVVAAVDVEESDQSLKRSQIFKACQEIAKVWGRVAGRDSNITLKGSLVGRNSVFPLTNGSCDCDLLESLTGVRILDLSGWAIPGRVHWQDDF